MLLLAQSTGDSLKTKAQNKQEAQTPTQKERNKQKETTAAEKSGESQFFK